LAPEILPDCFALDSVAVSLARITSPGTCAPVFDYGGEWKYFVGTQEASSPDMTAWRRASFDDLAWTSSLAPIGYANPPGSPAEFNLVTILPPSSEANYLSAFFRKKFLVAQPGGVAELTLNINVDDGFIAWINGTEVGRYNVPDGDLNYYTAALSAIEPTLVPITITNNITSLLVSGENVVAVQVFNANLSSSDLFFDAALESDLDETPPVVSDTSPIAGSVVPQLGSVEIVFSEGVQGVDASDLWINGVPATGLNVMSPRNYAFSFPQPQVGTVRVEWAPNHGITDLSSARNAFTGENWNYTLDPRCLCPRSISSSWPTTPTACGMTTAFDQIGLSCTPSSEAVNLNGWFLTDDPSELTKWRLPRFPSASTATCSFGRRDKIGPTRPLPCTQTLSSIKEVVTWPWWIRGPTLSPRFRRLPTSAR
jgi:hypothetical protein